MFNIPLATSSTCLQPNQFWNSVFLYYNRPHIVNRKLAAVSEGLICKINIHGYKYTDIFTKSAVTYEVRKLDIVSKDNINVGFVKNLVECFDKNAEVILMPKHNFINSSDGLFVSVRILYPRLNHCKPCVELAVFSKTENKVMFIAIEEKEKLLCSIPFPYEIELSSDLKLKINVSNFDEADTVHAEWLAVKLFMKILSWTVDEKDEKNITSLSLVPADDYCLTYRCLKEKYSHDLVKRWPTKAGTNPQKYVYEDIAIASYLICLWKKYNKNEINFVDCGCGNGLLVYFLSQEGYKGFGIDVRKRATWDMFPDSTELKVGAVTPASVFPDSTWIIGNHSDELTPWIPVISLNSSLNTNFFVLPCCTYDFSGQKYVRTDTSMSTYADYLNYIKKICQICGFETSEDKLRIPSTKRICFIGVKRKCNNDEHKYYGNEITNFIKTRDGSINFRPRSDIEKVRNCTQLSRDLLCKLIQKCVSTILEKESNILFKESGEKWNKGGSITLPELSSVISTEDRKQLKKECGGLQTLLRNHRYIFELANSNVMLRLPIRLVDSSQYKSKPCWFLKNHPNGCLYDDSSCGYSHE